MLSNLPNKTVLGERWETVGIVGSGACAQVYKVRSTSSAIDYDLVAKVVPFAKSKSDKVQDRICNTLNYEYMMYNGLLSGFPFCPRVPPRFYGDDLKLKVRYMVMEQMDRDLEAVSKDSIVPSPPAIAQFGLQILEGLKWIHQRGFIFIDVKPANFMLKKDRLYFVDFGLVERLKVMPAGKTDPGRQFSGTPTFSSIATFNGEQPGAHDDLEAMGLVLLSLTMGGVLPWSSAKSDAEIKQMKESCDIKRLSATQGVPEIGEIVTLCRTAARTSRPDYDAIQQLLNALSARKPSATGASKIAAKVVSVATSSSSGRGKVGKMSSATPSETIAPQADLPPKPLTAAAQKRASKLAASSSSSAAAMSSAAMGEDATELTLPPNRTSPATKRSRTTRPAASLVADHTAPPPVPPVAPAAPARAQPVSGQKPSPRAAAAASTPAGTPGPFSSSSSSYSSSASASVADATAAVDGAAVVAGISPTLFTRARARLPNPAPSFIPHPDPIPEESTGPFSAAFKLSDRRSSRGRSLSPAPVQGSGHAAPSSAGASSESAAGVSASASVAVAFEFRVTKGPCKGQVFRVACPGSGGDSGTGRGGAGKKSGSRAKAPLSVTQTVGRGDDGDGGVEVDVALSKDQHLSARHFGVTVTKKNQAVLLEDLGSTDGTSLNGQKIEANMSVEVQDGDLITAGKSVIVCRKI